jgi:EAL domain-containing protein (putative c-di-GMP-specific phosphodiesterase class I)
MPPSDTLPIEARPNTPGPALPAPVTPAPLRNADRFLAFAFASADLLVETDIEGVIGFAAGAFRSRLGCPAQTYVGQRITSLFAASDRETLEIALAMVRQNGRIAPMQIALADIAHSPVSVGAFLLQNGLHSARLSFSIGPIAADLNTPHATPRAVAGPRGFARIAELALRQGSSDALSLLEVQNWAQIRESMSGPDRNDLEMRIGDALSGGAQGGVAGAFAEGRYGVVADGPDLTTLVHLLERALQGSPEAGTATVTGTRMQLSPGAMPAPQAARALRYALGRFADGGLHAANAIGAGAGFAGIIASAGQHAAAVRETLEARRFRLLYQPVVWLSDRSIHHFEALIRPFPIKGMPTQAPQDFVNFAEALGLSEMLDWAVLETALAALDETVETCVAVNMSGLSMQNPAYRKRLLDRLQSVRTTAGKHAPSRLMIELTETAEIEDLPAAASTMEQLRSVGVPVCLDDFGAGVAVFRYLRAFGVDHVKLDGDYVRSACKSRRDRSLVASMVELAATAGASVTAEMIETDDQAKTMLDLGVQFGQGWLFGRPGRLPGRR